MTAHALDAAGVLGELGRLSAPEQLRRFRAPPPTGGGPQAISLTALAEEAERLAIVDLNRAVEATAMLIDLSDALGDALGAIRARRARGQVLAYANRFEEALAVLEKAIELARLADQPLEAARAQSTSLHALARLGRYDQAIATGEAARAAFLSAGDTLMAGRADINLGVIHRMRDDPATALALFERARPVFVTADQPMIVAQLDSNRAEALLDLHRFADAEQAFTHALEVFQRSGMHRAAAIVEGNLADLMSLQGRLERALFYFERARRSMETDNAAPGDLARLSAEQAEAMLSIGMLDEALASFRSVIPKLQEHGLGGSWEAARAQAGLGRTLLRLGRLYEADSALKAGAALLLQLQHHTGHARLQLLQGQAARAAGDSARARQLFEEALGALEQRPADAAIARYQLAGLELDSGTPPSQDCENLLDTALATAEELNLAPLLADLHHAKARLCRARGLTPPTAALLHLRAAANQVERLRGTLQAERFRAAFLGNRLAIHEDLAAMLVEQGDAASLAEAFAVIERAKSRSLLETVKGAIDIASDAAGADELDPGAAELLQDLVRLRSELNALYARLDGTPDLRTGTPGSESRATSHDEPWRHKVERCERDLATVESRLAATRGVGGLFAPPIELPAAQELLTDRSAIVEYFIAQGEVMALVIRQDRIAAFGHLGKLEALQEAIERFGFQIGRAIAWSGGSLALRAGSAPGSENRATARLLTDMQQELRELYDMLWAPLAGAVAGLERVIIVPHGPLHSVPFHALWNGKRYLIQDHEVLYGPSASVLEHLRSRSRREADHPPHQRGGPLLVGVPDASAPQIEREIHELATILKDAAPPRPPTVLLGAQATWDRFAQSAQHADLIHLATHGRFSPSMPMSSGLKLGDRWMTVRDLYALRLRASCVTLSGCDTGLSAVTSGDELVGLQRGFFAAGASALVTSLWSVADESAANLVAWVYKAWYTNAQGSQKSAARSQRSGGPLTSDLQPLTSDLRPLTSDLPAQLRAAMCQMMIRQPHPVYWAPFILVGIA